MLTDPSPPVLFFVEGVHDIRFFKTVAKMLHADDEAIPDLEFAEALNQLIFVPVGGDPRFWALRFAPFGCVEFHIYDREVEPITTIRQNIVTEVNRRVGCTAMLTSKRSLEAYLHAEVVQKVFGIDVAIDDDVDLTETLARRALALRGEHAWSDLTRRQRLRLRYSAKTRLNSEAAKLMTAELLAERDPQGEVIGWLREIGKALK